MRFSLIPNLMVPSLTAITADLLHSQGIDLLMLDFDNTIVPYTSNEPSPEMRVWLEHLSRFGIAYCVVSNSRKPRVVEFCKRYQIPCITHAKKPFSRGIEQALSTFPHSGRAALAGDQIYTDVLGANCAGAISILVRPIHLHNWPLKLRHVAELPFIAIGKRRMKYAQS